MTNGYPVSLASSAGHANGELGVCVQARADRRAAQGQLTQVRDRFLDVLEPVVQKLDPAGDLLAERERRRVHQVRPPDLDELAKRLGLLGQRVAQHSDRRDQPAAKRLDGGDVHGGRKHVVRRLAHVDLIVGMDLPLHSALAAQQFAGAVGDHLVHVHVGLRTAAGLPDDQRKLGVVSPGDHLVGGRDDRLGRSRDP